MYSREISMNTLRKNTDSKIELNNKVQGFIKSRMTEVIIPQGQNSNHILFPLVASLSKQQENTLLQNNSKRWVTWITDRKPSKHQLDSFGSNNAHIRIIHRRAVEDNRWVIWEALNTGNSHTVIADIASVTKEDITQFEAAARQGNCVGILARSLNTI
jgi:cell division inhibitor SulA